MKKLSIFLLAILSIFMIASCGDGGSSDSGGGSKPEPPIVDKDEYVRVVFIVNKEIFDEMKVRVGDYIDEKEVKIPHVEGYKFHGWDFDFSMPIEGEMKIAAKMEPIKDPHPDEKFYIVNIDFGFDGKGDEFKVKQGDIVYLPNIEREGYVLKGFECKYGIFEKEFEFKFDHDLYLTAIWEKVDKPKPDKEYFTITYHLGEGMNHPENPTKVEMGSYVKLYPAYSPEAQFLGWYLDPEFKEEVYEISNINRDYDLYARYENVVRYKITYELNGGKNHPNNPDYFSENNMPYIEAPTKDSSKFMGWFLDSDFKEQFKDLWGIERDITLYAKWEEAYNITYVLNGGENAYDNPTTIGKNEIIYFKPAYSNQETYFVGWYLDKDFKGDPIESLDGSKLTGDVTLYAKWQNEPFKITIDYGNGKTEVIEVFPGEWYYLTRPEDQGDIYFDCFEYEGERFSESGKFTFGKDITVKVVWIYPTYSIDYEVPYDAIEPEKVSFEHGEEVILAPAVYEHYIFEGWYLEDTYVTKIEKINKDENHNFILYGKFTPKTYKITYELNGGTNDPDNPTEAEYNTWINLNQPKKPGYYFRGWQDQDGNAIYSFTITGDTTLTALFEAETYRLTIEDYYDYNFEVTYKGNYALPETLEKAGYRFMGYTLNGEAFPSKGVIDFIPTQSNQICVVPIFEIRTYHITYETNGGILELDALKEYTVENLENSNIYLNTSYKPGYNFVGWYTDKELTTRAEAITKDNMADLTVYAKWSQEEYMIYFNDDTVTGITEILVHYGDEVVLPDGVKEFHKFLHWEYNGKIYEGGKFGFTASISLRGIFELADPSKKINYHLDGGINHPNNPEFIDYNYGLKAATKPGYMFIGWYNKDFTKEYTIINPSITDVYAKFKPLTYNVIYVADNKVLYSEKVNSGEALTGITTNIPGYRIIGYALDGKNISLDKFDFARNVEIEVLIEEAVYNLTYDYDGGEVTKANPATALTTDAFYLNKPTKPGYKFIKYIDNNGNDVNYITGLASDLTLTAQYELETYNILYSSDFYYDTNPNPGEYTILDEVIFKDILKEGYLVEGFYLNDEKITKLPEGTTGDITIVIKFVPKKITLNVIYSFADVKGYSKVYDYGTQLNVYDIIDPAGYNVDSVTYGDITTSYGFSIIGETEMNVTANISTYKYDIQYHNGSYYDDKLGGNNPTSITVRDKVILENGVLEDCAFFGWYLDKNLTKPIKVLENITSNIKLYGDFRIHYNTVTIDYADGTSLVTLKQIPSVKLTLKLPTRFGYKFIGFYDEAKDNYYAANEGFYVYPNMQLKAIWEEEALNRTFTISFKTPDNQNIEKLTVKRGKNVILPELASNENNYFAGWAIEGTDKKLGKEFVFYYEENITLVPYYNLTDGEFEYQELEGAYAIVEYIGEGNGTKVPDTYNNKPVTTILSGAFFRGPSEVILGDNIVTIEDYSFDFRYVNRLVFGKNIKDYGVQYYKEGSYATFVNPNSNFNLGMFINGAASSSYVNIELNYDSTVDYSINLLRNIDKLDYVHISLELRGFNTLKANMFGEARKNIYKITLLDDVLSLVEADFNLKADYLDVYDFEAYLNADLKTNICVEILYNRGEELTHITIPESITTLKPYLLGELYIEELILPKTLTRVKTDALLNTSVNNLIIYNKDIIFENNSTPNKANVINYAGSEAEFGRLNTANNSILNDRNIQINFNVTSIEYISTPEYSYKLISNKYIYDLVLTDSKLEILDFEEMFKGYIIDKVNSNTISRLTNLKLVVVGDNIKANLDNYIFYSYMVVLRTKKDVNINEDDSVIRLLNAGKFTHVLPSDTNPYDYFVDTNKNVIIRNITVSEDATYDISTYFKKLGLNVIYIMENAANDLRNQDHKNIVIPGTIKYLIGFTSSGNYDSFRIEDGVETLGQYEFQDSFAKNLYLPDSLKNLYAAPYSENVYISSLEKWLSLNFDNSPFAQLNPNEALYCGGVKLTDLVVDKYDIPSGAFQAYEGLKTLTINESRKFGHYAFLNIGLEKITVKSLDVLFNSIFTDNTSSPLNSYYGLLYVGDKPLTTLTIKENMNINEYALTGYGHLEELIIDSPNATINESFGGAGIKSLKVKDINDFLKLQGGFSFFKEAGAKLEVLGEDGNYSVVENIQVPAEIDTLATGLFSNYSYLKTVEYLGPISYISPYTFRNCQNLTSVKFAAGTKDISLDDGVFLNCINLEQLDIKVIKDLGHDALKNCSKLKYDYVDSIKSIYSHALDNVTIDTLVVYNYAKSEFVLDNANIRKIIFADVLDFQYINESVKSIEVGEKVDRVYPHKHANNYYINVENIYVDSKNPNFTVSDTNNNYLNALISKNGEEIYLALDNALIPKSVKKIHFIPISSNIYYEGTRAEFMDIELSLSSSHYQYSLRTDVDFKTTKYYNENNLSYLVLNGEIENVRLSDSFNSNVLDLTNLKGNLKDFNLISYNNAATINRITEVKLPNTVKSLHSNLFNGFTNLEKINLPEGLEHIYGYVFSGTKIKNVKLPTTLKTLDCNLFGLDEPATDGSYTVDVKDIYQWLSINIISHYFYDNLFDFGIKLLVNGQDDDYLVLTGDHVINVDNLEKAYKYIYVGKDIKLNDDYNYNRLTRLWFFEDPNSKLSSIVGAAYYENGVNAADISCVDNAKASYIQSKKFIYDLFVKQYDSKVLNLYAKHNGRELRNVAAHGFDAITGLKVLNSTEYYLGDGFDLDLLLKNNPEIEFKLQDFRYETIELIENATYRYLLINNTEIHKLEIVDKNLLIADLRELEVDGITIISLNEEKFTKELKLMAILLPANLDDDLVLEGDNNIILANKYMGSTDPKYLGVPDANSFTLVEEELYSYIKIDNDKALLISISNTLKDVNLSTLIPNIKIIGVKEGVFKDAVLDSLEITRDVVYFGPNAFINTTAKNLTFFNDRYAIAFDEDKESENTPLKHILGVEVFRGNTITSHISQMAKDVTIEQGENDGRYIVDLGNSESITKLTISDYIFDNARVGFGSLPNLLELKVPACIFDEIQTGAPLLEKVTIYNSYYKVGTFNVNNQIKHLVLYDEAIRDYKLFPNVEIIEFKYTNSDDFSSYDYEDLVDHNKLVAIFVESQNNLQIDNPAANIIVGKLESMELKQENGISYYLVNNKYTFLKEVDKTVTSLDLEALLPDLTGIVPFAFKNASSLESLVLPNKLPELGIKSLTGLTTIKELVLPDETLISERAFINSSIEKLIITSNTKNNKISNSALVGSNVRELVILGSTIANEKNSLVCENDYIQTLTAEIAIINKLDLKYVKTLNITKGDENNAVSLYSKNGIENVILDSSITTISPNSFANSSIKSILMPGVTTIGNSAFRDVKTLKTITLPDCLETIDHQAFYGTGVKEWILPEGVKTIANNVFTAFDKLVIPTTVTSLGYIEALNGVVIIKAKGLTDELSLNTKLVVIDPSLPNALAIQRHLSEDKTFAVISETIPEIKHVVGTKYEYDLVLNEIYNLEIKDRTAGVYDLQADLSPNIIRTIKDFTEFAAKKVVIPDSIVAYELNSFNEFFTEELHFNSFEASVVFNRSNNYYGSTSFTKVFIGNEDYNTLVIPGNIEVITRDMLCNQNGSLNTQIKTIIIEEGVKTLKADVLRYFSLDSLVLPNSLTTIEDGAFNNLNISTLVFPRGLKEYTGYSMNAKAIYIPSTIESFKLDNYYNLEAIVFEDSFEAAKEKGIIPNEGYSFYGIPNEENILKIVDNKYFNYVQAGENTVINLYIKRQNNEVFKEDEVFIGAKIYSFRRYQSENLSYKDFYLPANLTSNSGLHYFRTNNLYISDLKKYFRMPINNKIAENVYVNNELVGDVLVIGDEITELGENAFEIFTKVNEFRIESKNITSLTKRLMNDRYVSYKLYLSEYITSISKEVFKYGLKPYFVVDPNNKVYKTIEGSLVFVDSNKLAILLGQRVPQGIEIIGENSMSYENYSYNYLQLPKSLKEVAPNVIPTDMEFRIDYEGTEEEWKLIKGLESYTNLEVTYNVAYQTDEKQ